MKKLVLVALSFLALLCAPAFAQSITLQAGQVNVDLYTKLKAHSIAEYEDMRADLIEFVWKGSGVPTTLMPINVVGYNHARPSWVTPSTTQMTASHVRDPITPDVYSILYLLEPPTDGDCLFVYNFGHSGTFLYLSGTAAHERDIINAMLAQGCDVVLSFMPYNGDNAMHGATTFPNAGWNQLHNYMAAKETPTSTPIRYFMNPPIAGINWAIDRNGAYAKIGVGGHSGGGWTAVMLGALDTRITHTYSNAGTMPMHIRQYKPADYGDWEQYQSGYLQIADYLDLYILGALEPNRRSLQTWNTGDTCCFTADQSYAFTNQLKGLADRMGIVGLNFYVSSTNGHIISGASLAQILADFSL